MMQGEPLSPTIFNVVVDAVVRHWVELMVERAGGQDRHGREERHQSALFYADDGMVASSDPGWLQGAFSTLVGIFYRVGLRKNVGKMVGMVCRPCQAAITQLEAAYERWMMGTGLSYRERQRSIVQCSECGEEMAMESLTVHQQKQHGKELGGGWHWVGLSAPW